MPKGPAQPNKSLIDGLAVLQAVSAHREPVAGAQLARDLGLEPTRVNRLLKTLASLDVVYRTRERKYAPGPGMHVLAAQSLFASGLTQRALGPLESLSGLGLVVAMGVLWRDGVCYLYHWRPGLSLGEALGRTALYPATRSSIGMALLATREEAEVAELYDGRDIEGYDGLPALLAELRQIRERGYATVPAGNGITVGVSFGTPAYAAIAVAGSEDNVGLDERVEHLRRTVAQIEAG